METKLSAEGREVSEAIGWEVTEKERQELAFQFVCARAGDHLMETYQCELCHFHNIFHRDPHEDAEEDMWVMTCIIRANLDAFWSQRPSTVANNLGEMKRAMRIANSMRFNHQLEVFKRGPFPVQDTFGVVPAIISLQRSLNKGNNSRTIPWNTMRGVRSAMSNFMHSTPRGKDGFIMSDGKRSTQITGSSTNTLWFKRFMDGSHKRMGDVKVQDTALTVDVLLGLQQLLTAWWIEATDLGDEELLYELAVLGCIVTAGFSSGLQGEELGHILLNKTVLLTTQGLRHARKPHLVLGLEGRFKGQVSRKKHKIPIVGLTRSGINNQEWLMRLVERYEKANIVFGPLIRANCMDQSSASIKQMKMLFHRYLLCLQEQQPHLFAENVNIISLYSVRRSLCRGSTSQARNAKEPREVINLNNRWRSEEAANNRFAGRGEMLELYTDALAAIDTLLQYLEPL